MNRSVKFRWLGTAGIELSTADQVLIVDPYVTRFPLRKLMFGRVQPEQALIAQTLERCDNVLVTHAHFDHVMDVPEVIANTGATAYGSANACQLLRFCGTPERNLVQILAGDVLELGEFQVEARYAQHVKLPGFGPGTIAPNLELPLCARDYVMDTHLSFRISLNGHRLLTDPGVQAKDAAKADVLFVSAGLHEHYYNVLLARVRPRVVVPIHWDDFFRPLSEPTRTHWKHPRRRWPPLERVNLAQFSDMITRLSTNTRVLVPKAMHSYHLLDFL